MELASCPYTYVKIHFDSTPSLMLKVKDENVLDVLDSLRSESISLTIGGI